MSNTKAQDFFESDAAFEYMLGEAEEKAQGDIEVKFVDDLAVRATQYGIEAFLSQAQYEWLKKISER